MTINEIIELTIKEEEKAGLLENIHIDGYLQDGEYLYIYMHEEPALSGDSVLISKVNLLSGQHEFQFLFIACLEWGISLHDERWVWINDNK